jgi:hypothetical protein
MPPVYALHGIMGIASLDWMLDSFLHPLRRQWICLNVASDLHYFLHFYKVKKSWKK